MKPFQTKLHQQVREALLSARWDSNTVHMVMRAIDDPLSSAAQEISNLQQRRHNQRKSFNALQAAYNEKLRLEQKHSSDDVDAFWETMEEVNHG